MMNKTIAFALAVVVSSNAAATTHTYEGAYFNAFEGDIYTAANHVSGSFDFDEPLAEIARIYPSTWTFSDGLQTITQDNAQWSEFNIGIDANGGVTDWYIAMLGPFGGIVTARAGDTGSMFETNNCPDRFTCRADSFVNGFTNAARDGVWAQSERTQAFSRRSDPVGIAEPQWLTCLGVVALLALRKCRGAASKP